MDRELETLVFSNEFYADVTKPSAMNPTPRFQAEFFLRQNIEELRTYSAVFTQRVARAFDNLDSEAKRMEQEEYAKLCSGGMAPFDDSSWAAEAAYFKGVDFYLATDDIRQGVINLMVAGMYHLFEQQAAFLVKSVLPEPRIEPT